MANCTYRYTCLHSIWTCSTERDNPIMVPGNTMLSQILEEWSFTLQLGGESELCEVLFFFFLLPNPITKPMPWNCRAVFLYYWFGNLFWIAQHQKESGLCDHYNNRMPSKQSINKEKSRRRTSQEFPNISCIYYLFAEKSPGSKNTRDACKFLLKNKTKSSLASARIKKNYLQDNLICLLHSKDRKNGSPLPQRPPYLRISKGQMPLQWRSPAPLTLEKQHTYRGACNTKQKLAGGTFQDNRG